MNGESICSLLIVDDLESVLGMLRRIVQMKVGWYVVGEARNGIEAIAIVKQLRPDIVLMDINMPLMNGIEATRRIRQQDQKVCIILTSGDNDAEMWSQGFLAGADYCCCKEMLDTCYLDRITGAHFGKVMGR